MNPDIWYKILTHCDDQSIALCSRISTFHKLILRKQFWLDRLACQTNRTIDQIEQLSSQFGNRTPYHLYIRIALKFDIIVQGSQYYIGSHYCLLKVIRNNDLHLIKYFCKRVNEVNENFWLAKILRVIKPEALRILQTQLPRYLEIQHQFYWLYINPHFRDQDIKSYFTDTKSLGDSEHLSSKYCISILDDLKRLYQNKLHLRTHLKKIEYSDNLLTILFRIGDMSILKQIDTHLNSNKRIGLLLYNRTITFNQWKMYTHCTLDWRVLSANFELRLKSGGKRIRALIHPAIGVDSVIKLWVRNNYLLK